eukprot:c13538_g1_i2.p1 GENE.c13538_g1_i2~~c13538_g1_i2.p1  ORF type:complete len:741 (+),score=196.98 c13538_g1_i2:160-2223(+)
MSPAIGASPGSSRFSLLSPFTAPTPSYAPRDPQILISPAIRQNANTRDDDNTYDDLELNTELRFTQRSNDSGELDLPHSGNDEDKDWDEDDEDEEIEPNQQDNGNDNDNDTGARGRNPYGHVMRQQSLLEDEDEEGPIHHHLPPFVVGKRGGKRRDRSDARVTQNILTQLEVLRKEPKKANAALHMDACEELVQVLRDNPEAKSLIIKHHGVLPLKNILRSYPPETKTCLAALRVVSKLIAGDSEQQCELLCLAGFMPHCTEAAKEKYPIATRHLAVYFIWKLCHVSDRTLGMWVACGGLELLPEFIRSDWTKWRKVVRMGIQCLGRIFEAHLPISKYALCHMLAEVKIVEDLSKLLGILRRDSGTEAPLLLERVAGLLLTFTKVKDRLVREKVTEEIVLFNIRRCLVPGEVEPAVALSLLECIRVLALDPDVVGRLREAKYVPVLVENLAYYKGDHQLQHQIQIFNALFPLCRLDRARQGEAAMAGVIPHLQEYIVSNSPFKQFAVVMICDFAHAKTSAREKLWECDGLRFFVSLLYQDKLQVKALEALSAWLSDEPERVEPLLLDPQHVQMLVSLFEQQPNNFFPSLLLSFMNLLSNSQALRIAMGNTSIIPKLMEWISHDKPIVRVNLLKIIRLLFDSMSAERQQFTAKHMEPLVKVCVLHEESVVVKDLVADILRSFSKAMQN